MKGCSSQRITEYCVSEGSHVGSSASVGASLAMIAFENPAA